MYHSFRCIQQNVITHRKRSCVCIPCITSEGICEYEKIVGKWVVTNLEKISRRRRLNNVVAEEMDDEQVDGGDHIEQVDDGGQGEQVDDGGQDEQVDDVGQDEQVDDGAQDEQVDDGGQDKKTDDGWQCKIVIIDKDQQMENGNQDQQLDGRGHGKILATENK